MMRNNRLGVALVMLCTVAAFTACKKTAPVSQEPAAPVAVVPEQFQAEQQRAAEILGEKGVDKYKQRYFAPLIATYEKILTISPDSLDTKKKLGLAYFETGQHAKAEPLLAPVSESKLADADVWHALAAMAHARGEKERARSFSERALDSNPQHEGARALLKTLE